MPYINEKYQQMMSMTVGVFENDVDTKFVQAPIGGWDAISPIATMDPKYAPILDNWVPRPGWCEIRGGYNVWAQALGDNPVESLLVYRPSNSGERMFAAIGSEIWETTDYGMPSLQLSSLLNARWQSLNFTPAGGSNYLYGVNGEDLPILFDGTTWSNPTITGVNARLFVSINLHKRRLWFVEINSTRAWYLPTDAIQGAATLFDVGNLFTKGSWLLTVATWTVDGGNGPDDMLVLLSNKGQAAIYKGTDPSNANAWSLVGVFDLATPLGRRCCGKIGSDLAIITLQGLIPISQALPFDPAGERSVALTNRIQNAMLTAAQNGIDLFGWEVSTFPQQSLVVMNVPVAENSQQVQYVMNALTGAWCRFTGWNANCFAIYNESLYFGDNDGNVNLAYAGALDLVSPISFDMQCAFNYFDQPGRIKAIEMVRPMMVVDGTIAPTISADVDFADNSQAAPVAVLNPIGGVWDSAVWDTDTWASGSAPIINWMTIGGIGNAIALRMKINLGGTGSQVAQNSVFDTGVFDSMIFDGNGVITKSGVGIPVLKLNIFETLIRYGAAI